MILDFEAALSVAREFAVVFDQPKRVERISLLEARGRVLAETVTADRDQPPFDRSTRDGFAVIAAEFSAGQTLNVIGLLRAGEAWAGGPLQTGQAIEIMTGAPVPEGADAVAMVEHIGRAEQTVTAATGRTLAARENIVGRGDEAAVGTVVVLQGSVMGAAEIALAATCGHGTVAVYARPRVAIVATGDELVEVEETPGPQQIRNSNSYALAAMVQAAGGEAVRLPITADDRSAVAASLKRAMECDLMVLSGGVSMGEYDLVEEMLLAAGAEFFFTGVKMQPGKPVVFGRLTAANKFFFGLPGNPISTQVTFHCFVEPFLRAMCGEMVSGPRWALARLRNAVEPKSGVTRLLPCRMEDTIIRVVGWQGSGDLAANARANCYGELLPGQAYAGGDVIRVLLR